MTALAMIIGMVPMALGLGEGGEQNAPLGRAVIGGLIFATVATLMFVPVVFSIVHGRKAKADSTRRRRRMPRAPEKPMPEHATTCCAHTRRRGMRLRGYIAAGVVAGRHCRRRRCIARHCESRSGCLDGSDRLHRRSVDQSRRRQQGAGELVLPGDVQAFNSAPIYARVSGYLKKWYVDIGTPVKAGQLLAEIDIPDQDQQLAQARADLGTAIANQKLSAVTAKRWNKLAEAERRGAAGRRREEWRPRRQDRAPSHRPAPMSIVCSDWRISSASPRRSTASVTSRSVDIGALVPVGAPGATPLFTVADQSKLRIYVSVPQNYSAQIKPGMTATFTVPEYPDETFTATFVATASSVDAQPARC